MNSFVESLPKGEKTRLPDVEAGHVDSWLAKLKRADGGTDELSAVSRRRERANLSTFYTWAKRRYRLSVTPLDHAAPVPGVARHPENIVAIRSERDLKTLLGSLEPWPYWRAWAAVAMLAGPRFSEQQHLTLDDVDLEHSQITITNRHRKTKTGRQRRVPIEQTVLAKILREHLRIRREQRKNGKTIAERSEWLFPSLRPDGERTKSLPGVWCHNRSFHDAWGGIVKAAAPDDKPAYYWDHGPDEWRHTFGTVLGRCGMSSLEIARAMGNSEDVAQRHYVAVTAGAKRWGFEF